VIGDEATEHQLSSFELPWGEMMRKADPHARITSNTSTILNDLSEMMRYFKTIDRWEPDLDVVMYNPYLLDYLRLSAKPIALYRCRGAWATRGANMHDYYRVYAWHAIREGCTGMGLWTYCTDWGVNPWEKHEDQFALVLPHPTKNRAIVHTRRYETFREGIDDYRYVGKLRDVAKRKGPQAQAAVEKLIQEAIQDITSDVSDTTRCEKWRIKIAQMIETHE
jgi:hypothetical protein